MSGHNVTHSDLVEIAKRNGDFRRNYGVLVGAFLYLRSISAARSQMSWLAGTDSHSRRRAGSLVAMSKQHARELIELTAVFVILGGLLGFIREQGFGLATLVGAVGGGLLFALILSVGALLGGFERKT